MELLLSGEAEKIITQKLESGSYNSVEEVVMTALRLLENQDHDDLSRLRVEIEAGIEEAERGDLVDGEEVFRELRGRLIENRSIS
jgi:antitoxin ParD1/3/4